MKRILSLLLVFLIITSVTFIGISCKNETSSETVAEVTEAETTAAETPAETTAKSEEPVTINFWQLASFQIDAWTKRKALYEAENPNVTINLVPIENQNLREIMDSVLASKSEDVDLFFYWGGGKTFEWANAGLIYDMTNIFKENNFYDKLLPMAKAFEYNGKSYCLPTDWQSAGYIYYNKGIFKEVGVDVPQNLDELFDVSKKLTDAGYLPLTFGVKVQWPQMRLYNLLLTRYMSKEDALKLIMWGWSKDKSVETAEIFRSEGSINALKMTRKFAEDGVIPKEAIPMDDNAARLAFTSGKAAMYSSGQWITSTLREEAPDMDLSWFNIPPNSEGFGAEMAADAGDALMIPAYVDEKKIPVIADILNKSLTKEYAMASYDVGYIPVANSVPIDSVKDILDPTVLEIVSAVDEFGSIPWIDVWTESAERNKNIYDTVDLVFQGVITPEEGAQSLYDVAVGSLNQ
ncbi:MAG: ABC transporter substrate-binding protein [Candidatus Humimicrobiaceae bacterium]